MRAKICKYCGKQFLIKSGDRDYCSKVCKPIAEPVKRRKNESPCWTCQNACGNCSWSKNFKPVEGWDALPIIIKDSEGDIRSYKIKICPKYIFGSPVWNPSIYY